MHIIFIRIAGTASFPSMGAILLFSFIALCLEAHLRRNASYNENNIQKKKKEKEKKYGDRAVRIDASISVFYISAIRDDIQVKVQIFTVNTSGFPVYFSR